MLWKERLSESWEGKAMLRYGFDGAEVLQAAEIQEKMPRVAFSETIGWRDEPIDM